MIPRRRMVGATLTGGLLGLVSPASEAEAAQASDRAVEDVVQALNQLHRALEAQRSFAEIASVRQRQIDFLRANGKLPAFIEVGTDVWFGIHDWHIRQGLPIALDRDASGRYTITLTHTFVVLRPDLLPGYVGLPYDNR
jgi:hypothetical protein